MKKFVPLILVILVLAGAVVWFVLHKTSGTFDKEEDAFAVPNKKEITKVILEDSEKRRIVLAPANGVWMVNSKYAAREELVAALFDVISRIKTLCPVPRAAHDYVVRNIIAQSIKVQVFTNNDEQPVQVYYVGGPTPESTGTYMLREVDGKPDKRPYITYLPGLQGYLTPRYQTDEEVWRSRAMFKYTPESIKSVSVEYPAEESKSFTISRINNDSFALAPHDSKYAVNQPYQQKYIKEYLAFYSSVSIEVFDNNNITRDSVRHTTPYCIFTVTGTDNKVNRAELFYQPINRRSKMPFDTKGNAMTYDVDHYLASFNDDKDFAIVQYYVYGKLLRGYKDFFFKPGGAPETTKR